jgi:hypothetical protein
LQNVELKMMYQVHRTLQLMTVRSSPRLKRSQVFLASLIVSTTRSRASARSSLAHRSALA